METRKRIPDYDAVVFIERVGANGEKKKPSSKSVGCGWNVNGEAINVTIDLVPSEGLKRLTLFPVKPKETLIEEARRYY